jgi:cytochrome oxidase assembly protein ShyY1
VRGWAPTAADPPDGTQATGGTATDPTTVTVTGVLLPGEQAVDRAPGTTNGLPAGQVDRIDPADLVQRWDFPIHTGFVVAAPGSPGTAGLRPVTTTSQGGGLALQNLSYAIQWWLFALFGLFLWWRLVRDDARGLLRPRPGAPPPGTIDDDGALTTANEGSTS